jgi:nitrate reductase delta subunit
MFKKPEIPMQYTLRALARLLSYPDAELREQVPALLAAMREEAALAPARLQELAALARHIAAADAYEVEERYVGTFDCSRRTSLLLFEHVHGDSRERGQALVDLLQTYERAGLHYDGKELPDHLPVVLEFASTQAPELARSFLAEMAHILNALFSALVAAESPYASAIAAVLELAGEQAQTVDIPPEPDRDEDWGEPPAFDGIGMAGQRRPDSRAHRKPPEIRFVTAEDAAQPEGVVQ